MYGMILRKTQTMLGLFAIKYMEGLLLHSAEEHSAAENCRKKEVEVKQALRFPECFPGIWRTEVQQLLVQQDGSFFPISPNGLSLHEPLGLHPHGCRAPTPLLVAQLFYHRSLQSLWANAIQPPIICYCSFC